MPEYQIKLGDKTFTCQSPVRFKQLEIIEPALNEFIAIKREGSGASARMYTAISTIIMAVVSDAEPTFTIEMFRDLRLTGDELGVAVKAIATAAGMYKEIPANQAEGDSPPNAPSPSIGA